MTKAKTKTPEALARVTDQPWAIREVALREIASQAAGGQLDDFFGLMDREDDPPYAVSDGVAVLEIVGSLWSGRMRWRPLRSYDGIRDAFQAALEDDAVHAIVLSIDSPGGSALGLCELSDAIFAARGTKPITAVARGQMASAAYFIGSAADRIVAAREAMVGSIGTVLTVYDWSKFDEELGIREIEIVSSQSPKKRPDATTEEGRAQLQSMVDEYGGIFVEAVARNRGVGVDMVLADFGQGDVLVGARAVEAGLVDELGTVNDVIAGFAASHSRGGSMDPSKITVEWLEENAPAVAEALRAQGRAAGVAENDQVLADARTQAAEAERARIAGIYEAVAGFPGHDDLVAKMVSDPAKNAGDVALAIVAKERDVRAKGLADLRGDEDDIDVDDAPTSGVEDADKAARDLVASARKSGVVQ